MMMTRTALDTTRTVTISNLGERSDEGEGYGRREGRSDIVTNTPASMGTITNAGSMLGINTAPRTKYHHMTTRKVTPMDTNNKDREHGFFENYARVVLDLPRPTMERLLADWKVMNRREFATALTARLSEEVGMTPPPTKEERAAERRRAARLARAQARLEALKKETD